jgi:acetyltransferase-like isoleucine patch superfamily enzyme
MKQVLTKIARSPSTMGRLCFDRWYVPWMLRWLGVEIGPRCRFTGRPLITLVPGATIIFAEGVHLFSRPDSNPAGLPHPTILAALTPESTIIIGEKTGVSGASIVARTGITVGRNVLIGAGACLWDTDFHPVGVYERQAHPTNGAQCAPIVIQDDVFIGARALILKGVTVGWGAVIGAGAVVTKDVGPCQIVAGSPARIVGSAFPMMEQTRAGRV